MKCEICGESFDLGNLSSVIIHMHDNESPELAAQVIGVKGKEKQVIDAWVFISDYMTLSGLGRTAIMDRIRNGMLENKREKNKFLIHCKLTRKNHV